MRAWITFLICLIVAASMWLLRNLSETYSGVLSASIIVESNIEGRENRSVSPVLVSARCRDLGFYFLFNKLSTHSIPVIVKIDSEDFDYEGGDEYSIKNDKLVKYLPKIFHTDVILESFLSNKYYFNFEKMNFRKVPVVVNNQIEYRSQYMPVAPVKLAPDSVLIYGEPQRLEDIESVMTKPLRGNDVHGNLNGVLDLDPIAGVRISHNEIAYSLLVSRFVEIESDVKLELKHVPSGKTLNVIPSTAKITYRCMFPLVVDPSNKTIFYIDYQDFKNSINGLCVPKHERFPNGVIDYKIKPEVFECFEF